MLAFLKALILLPVVLIVVLLAIANRGPVVFSLDPFSKGGPELALTVPLYGLILAAVALGVVIGGVGAWLSGSRHRQSGRHARREANRLRREADRLRASIASTRTTALPAPRSTA